MSFEVNFDEGHYGGVLMILFNVYLCEHDSLQKGKSYEQYVKSRYPRDYEKYRLYRRKVEQRTPNIRRRYFDFLEDKADMPDFECFAILYNEGFKMNALMSIRPEFTDRIISGEKLYEFRKSIFKEDVDRIFIYTTAPRREIVGYFTPSKIIQDSPENLWDYCSEVSGISEKDFFKYYEGKSEGFAIGIDDLNVFEKPIDMSQYPEFHPPQSYLYIENDEFLTTLLKPYL